MKNQWKKLTAFLICAVLLAGMVPVKVQAEELPSVVKVSTTAKVCRQETREVLRMVNEERAKEGAAPIVMSAEMEEAAIHRAFELVSYCTHQRPDKRSFSTVFDEYGVETNIGFNKWIAENIATGQRNAEAVMYSWMNSSGHKGNIMASYYRYIGIGCVEYNGVKYWVQLFAEAPSNVTPASDKGTDGIETTKEYSVDIQNMISHSKFKTTKIEFAEQKVFVKPGDTLKFDLKLSAPDIIRGRNRVVGEILFSSLKPEHIVVSEGAPLSISEDGININADAELGTYTVTVTIGSVSAVKTIKVAVEPCTHPEEVRNTEERAPSCFENGYRKITCTECDEVISEEVLEKLSHEKAADWKITKEATCAEAGLRVKECIHCNMAMEEEILPKTKEHKWDEGTVTKEATCTATGNAEYTCTVCKTTRTETIKELGHNGQDVVTEATCTESGQKEVICTRCQAVLSVETIPAKGHSFGEWQTVTEPTWDTEGLEKRTCNRCGKEEENVIPALSNGHEHDFSGEETVVKQPACTEAGSKTIACTNPSCNAKKEVIIPETGHNPGEWEIIQEPTCAEEGKKQQKCTTCQVITDEEQIPKTEEHTWNDGETTKEADCTEEGILTYTCKICSSTRTETIEALGHEEQEAVTEPTCTETGKREVTCKRCEEVLSTEIIPMLGHQWSEWENEKDATWDEKGSAGRTCGRCEVKEEKEIPPLSEGHVCDFSKEAEITKKPTCTEDGSKTAVCSESRCGKTDITAVPALGHKETEKITQKPTCTKPGEKTVICSRCKELLFTEAINASGHQWSEWKMEHEPTWDSEGMQKRICENCNETEEQTLPKLSDTHEHDYTGAETITKEPTCTEDGSKSVVCSNPECDAEITEAVPAVGHSAGDWETVTEATETENGLAVQKCMVCGEKLAEKMIPAEGKENSDWETITEADEIEDAVKTEEATETENVADENLEENGTSEQVVKTGDDTAVLLWLVLAIGAAALGTGVILAKQEKEK